MQTYTSNTQKYHRVLQKICRKFPTFYQHMNIYKGTQDKPKHVLKAAIKYTVLHHKMIFKIKQNLNKISTYIYSWQ